jgi:hypothetical protein
MSKQQPHFRILPFAFTEAFQYARLIEFHEEERGDERDLVITFKQFQVEDAGELLERDGHPFVRLSGCYKARRVRFPGLLWSQVKGAYRNQDAMPEEDPARDIIGMLHWMTPGGDIFYLLLNGSEMPPSSLFFSAGDGVEERARGVYLSNETVTIERDWYPAPPLPVRLVPAPRQLRARYGGDPVTVWMDGKAHHRRLFVGGLDEQGEVRPGVHAVLSLSEDHSRWVKDGIIHPDDRRVLKGEGTRGMPVDEIIEEANWVVERLRAAQRVLVHCSAGFNRSPTICCAVLILMEGLSAEAALERVREHHPWAMPDAHHWLALRWLAAKR